MKNHKKRYTILLFVWVMATAFGNPAAANKEKFYDRAQNKAASDQDQLQNKLLWINHINLAGTKILTYKNKLVQNLSTPAGKNDDKRLDNSDVCCIWQGEIKGTLNERT